MSSIIKCFLLNHTECHQIDFIFFLAKNHKPNSSKTYIIVHNSIFLCLNWLVQLWKNLLFKGIYSKERRTVIVVCFLLFSIKMLLSERQCSLGFVFSRREFCLAQNAGKDSSGVVFFCPKTWGKKRGRGDGVGLREGCGGLGGGL